MRRSPRYLPLGFGALLALSSCSGAPPPVPQPPAQCCTATIQVTVPEGTGTVYLAGSLPELGPWRPDGLVMTGQGHRRSVRVTAPRGTSFEYKFTLGAWDREAVGPGERAPPNN